MHLNKRGSIIHKIYMHSSKMLLFPPNLYQEHLFIRKEVQMELGELAIFGLKPISEMLASSRYEFEEN